MSCGLQREKSKKTPQAKQGKEYARKGGLKGGKRGSIDRRTTLRNCSGGGICPMEKTTLSGFLAVFGRIDPPLNVISQVHRQFNGLFVWMVFVPVRRIKGELKAVADHLLATINQRFVHDLSCGLMDVIPQEGRDSDYAIAFMDDLRDRLANRVQLISD